MRAWITPEQSLTIQRSVASFKIGTSRSLRVFQRMLSLMASATSAIPLGLLHMLPLQSWLKAHVLSHASHLGRFNVKVTHRCIRALAPWKTSRLFLSGVPLGLTSRGHDRCLQPRLGRSVRGRTSVRLLVKPGAMSAYQPRWSQVTLPSQVG